MNIVITISVILFNVFLQAPFSSCASTVSGVKSKFGHEDYKWGVETMQLLQQLAYFNAVERRFLSSVFEEDAQTNTTKKKIHKSLKTELDRVS